VLGELARANVVYDLTVISHGPAPNVDNDSLNSRAFEIAIFRDPDNNCDRATDIVTRWLKSENIKFRLLGDITV